MTQNEDNYKEQFEQLSTLKMEASAVGHQFIEVQWGPVSNTHFKEVTYSVYLDGQKIVAGLTGTKYSLINLKAGQAYSIKTIASTPDGKEVEQMIVVNTLSSVIDESKQTIYQEYKIHNYSVLAGPTAVEKCSDGGHLVVRFLWHPDYFGDGSYKIIFFKVDKKGQMLWYRLLSTIKFNFSVGDAINITLHNQEKEAMVFIQHHIFKIATSNGDIILERDLRDILVNQTVQSVFKESEEQVILGTGNGNLLSINPKNLSHNWHQTNPERFGVIVAISMDSKKNIYYIFRDLRDERYKVRIHKCNAKGIFLNEFLFDGNLNDENYRGFWMNSLLVDAEDNFYVFGYTLFNYHLRCFKFGADGKFMAKDEPVENLTVGQSFFNSKGEIVVVGQKSPVGLQTYAGIHIYDKDLKLKSKRFYTDIPYHIVSGVTGNLDGSYNIFLNYMKTYSYENSNFVFIKTDADGKM